MLGALIADGTLPLLALGLILLEALVLLWLARARPWLNRGAILANGASGAALLLALRAALLDQPPSVVVLWLGASLVAHLADLGARWRAGRQTPSRRPY